MRFSLLFFYTGRMKGKATAPRDSKKWVKTQYANLVRYQPSGKIYARLRIKGKLIWKSLKTANLDVAKRELAKLENIERTKAQNQVDGKLTFGECLEAYLEGIRSSDRKPRTVDYYEQRKVALLKSWPGIERLKIAAITPDDCEGWGRRFRKHSSSSAFNHTLGMLKRVFAVGIAKGCRLDNPAEAVERRKEVYAVPKLPTSQQFVDLVQEIRNGHGRFSAACADLVEFLAYGGFRISEAKHILWGDVNLGDGDEGGYIVVRGGGEGLKGRAQGEERRIPIVPPMRRLLARLKAEGDASDTDRVMAVAECQKALDRAVDELGIPRITHHGLRHLFATRCIESGVDIPTVSRWLGHKDGGALAMRIYGHLRDEHSQAQAAKVDF